MSNLQCLHLFYCTADNFFLFHSDKEDEQNFQKYHRDFPANEKTDHGEPFWNWHSAKALLKQDVEISHEYELASMEIFVIRKENKAFWLHTLS